MTAAVVNGEAGVVPAAVQASAPEAGGVDGGSTVAGSESDGGQGRGLTTIDFVLVALVALIVSTVVMFVGWYFVGQKQSFAVIDLPGIVEVEQLQFQANLMKDGVSDRDRAVEYERVKSFGTRLEAAIDQVRKNCNCIIFTRGAFVGQTKDVTNDVKVALGSDKINVEELKARVQRDVQRSMPDITPRK